MNEFDLIEKYISPVASSKTFMGKGDDCSVLYWDEQHYLIQSTDSLVEDVHFRNSTFSPEELAHKSFAANISDIHAMGGEAHWVHLSLAIPKSFDSSKIKIFLETFQQVSNKYQVELVGGDLSYSPGLLFINVHISGLVEKKNIKFRKDLSQKSVLFTTGPLGLSGAGLYCIENKLTDFEDLIKHHTRPTIVKQQSRWLAKQATVLGMMDLSDGLISDLDRIKGATKTIELDSLKIDPRLFMLAEQTANDPLKWLLAGGEDYQILANCSESSWDKISTDFKNQFGCELFKIGYVEPGETKTVLLKQGQVYQHEFKSFNHFD